MRGERSQRAWPGRLEKYQFSPGEILHRKLFSLKRANIAWGGRQAFHGGQRQAKNRHSGRKGVNMSLC